MGTDPVTPTYDPGADCNTCKDIIFDGVTPLYVEAHVDGIAACPGIPFALPNGVFLLTQTVPCTWIFNDGAGTAWQWILNPADSRFLITFVGFFWFVHIIAGVCNFTFTNTNVCGVALAIGLGGTVEVFWGPTIDP